MFCLIPPDVGGETPRRNYDTYQNLLPLTHFYVGARRLLLVQGQLRFDDVDGDSQEPKTKRVLRFLLKYFKNFRPEP